MTHHLNEKTSTLSDPTFILPQDGRSRDTPANLAAALGSRQVSMAAAMLSDADEGQGGYDERALCSQISSAVFDQVQEYPLDRPDVRTPAEGSQS